MIIRGAAVALVVGLAAVNGSSVSGAAAATTTRVRPSARGGALGQSVAVSGNTAVAGVPGVDAAYIYQRTGSVWRRQARLTNPVSKGFFGGPVAVSDGLVLVGGQFSAHSSAVYVFAHGSSGWSVQATIADPGRDLDDCFGSSLAASGTVAIIGDLCANGTSGLAYAFVRSGKSWHRQHTFHDPGGGPFDEFGTSAAVTSSSAGTFAVIGENDAGPGAAWAYARVRGTWHRQAALFDPDRSNDSDFFASAVAVSPAVAVVGAFAEGSAGTPGSGAGAVYIWVRSGATWLRRAKLDLAHTSRRSDFGEATAISGSRLLIGAPGSGCGVSYEFVRARQTWRLASRITDPRCVSGDGFGEAVAVWGHSAIIGAPGKNKGAGQVYFRTLP